MNIFDVGFQRPRGSASLAFEIGPQCLKDRCNEHVDEGVAWCEKHAKQLRTTN